MLVFTGAEGGLNGMGNGKRGVQSGKGGGPRAISLVVAGESWLSCAKHRGSVGLRNLSADVLKGALSPADSKHFETAAADTAFILSLMKTRVFLIFCAVGLLPIALSYGAKPSVSLDSLFGISVASTNLTHIMRAVMGLYLAMVLLWVLGAFKRSLAGPALVSCAVFMLGLAAGRVLSFILDGCPTGS